MKPLMSETRTAMIGALIIALGSVSMALYTPALPDLVEVHRTSPAAIKLSISVFLVGFAFAQLVCGSLLDAFGRRRTGLSFYSAYVLCSAIAAFSPSPKANRTPSIEQIYPHRVVRNYENLIIKRSFVRGSLVLGFAIGAFYTLAAMLPFVLMDQVGLTPTEFGLVMLAQTGFYAVGAMVALRLLRRIEVMRLLPTGLLLIAGTASALAGFLQIGIGLAGTVFAASVLNDPLMAVRTVMPGMAGLAILSHFFIRLKTVVSAKSTCLGDLK